MGQVEVGGLVLAPEDPSAGLAGPDHQALGWIWTGVQVGGTDTLFGYWAGEVALNSCSGCALHKEVSCEGRWGLKLVCHVT